MPSVSDFESWPVFSQAALIGVGVVMAWRGLHLSGDKGRLKYLWGFLCIGSFLLALYNGAWSNHDALQSVSKAHSEQAKIQTSLTAIQKALAKVAGAAQVNPDQSAQALADQIIDKLSALQKQVDQTASRVTTLEHPAHNPDSLYQNDKIVASFISGRISKDQSTFEFLEIYNANAIDFSQHIDFRGLVLQCQSHGINAGIEMTQRGAISNVMNGVLCSVISGHL